MSTNAFFDQSVNFKEASKQKECQDAFLKFKQIKHQCKAKRAC